MSTPANYPMFVSIDGHYGSADDLREFSYGDINDKQWELLLDLHHTDRHRYISAILDNDPDELAFFEDAE